MSRNSTRIKEGIKTLVFEPYQIQSGLVVAGSYDSAACTVSVQTSEDLQPIKGVMINSTSNNGNGVSLVPKDNSDVVIGCIDGPGEWVVLKTGDLEKVIVKIGSVVCDINSAEVHIQNGNATFNVGDSIFKINTASESLFQLLNDLLTGLTLLTVTTSTGPSSVPINTATFTNLATRLNNLLSA